MTVAISQSKVIYTGNGQTTQWDIPFPFLSKEDIKVYIKESNGTLTLLTNQYSIDENSAILTYPVAGNGVPALDSTQKLIIVRNTPRTQETDLAAQGTIDPDALEGNDDKAMLVCQELAEEIGRCLKFPVDSAVNEDDPATYLVNISSAVSTVQDAVEQAQEYAEISQSANINKVDKTGDTMTGNLIVKTSSFDASEVAPESTSVTNSYFLSDKNNINAGRYYLRNTGSGYLQNCVVVNDPTSSNTSSIGVQIHKTDGVATGFAPTPAAASNSTDIATTAWVRGYGADTSLSNINNDGKIVAANMSMPSDTYDTLTFGASGSKYTAPASGYFVFSLSIPNNSYFAIFADESTQTSDLIDIVVSTKDQNYIVKAQVLAGKKIRIQYGSGNVTSNSARFYYAEGNKSLHIS